FAIQLIEGGEQPIISKLIRLNPDFTFSLNCGRPKSEDAITGFGFTAQSIETSSFSWEWFRVDAPGHATKIQEEGEVTFWTAEMPDCVDIVGTRFLKALSCRVIRAGIDHPFSPHWRVEIAAKSQITWPSLIDGKIVTSESHG
ncbi:MAG: hypothetical protein QOJ65_1513, partial [Fimbriimonadaceae bacterium]|nr:hypothetical protein [Fimbriimonadaceae bacterium]